jgi:cell wall assembly regulator SMI1
VSAADRLRALADLRWTDEDGRASTFRLTPPPDAAALARLETRLGGALPPDARAVLAVGSGLVGSPLESVDFAGALDEGIESELFPGALPIAHDGFGNFWMIEHAPGQPHWGPIYFVCHDPPVAVYQCAELAEFLDGLRALATPPHEGPLDFVHEQASARVWHERPGAVPQPEAARSADAAVADFARALGEDWWVVDLRRAQMGDGIAWGRFGPRTELRRAGSAPIFGYGPPPPRPSWWRTLLGLGAPPPDEGRDR